MIRVERSTVPPPAVLEDHGSRETRRAVAHYAEDEERRFRFETYRRPEVTSALRELFADKCAYCESALPKGGKIEHFRPIHRAINLDGQSELGYFWLANTWDNLYLSCPVCYSNKGHRFPVAGGRARSGDAVDREHAILLDPCAEDPAPYLVFLEDGRVAAAPPDSTRIPEELHERFGGADRGQITIDVLGLNRTTLVEARSLVYAELKVELETLFWRPEEGYPPLEGEIRDLIDDALPHAGLRRQVVAEWLDEFAGEWGIDLFGALEPLPQTEDRPEEPDPAPPDAPLEPGEIVFRGAPGDVPSMPDPADAILDEVLAVSRLRRRLRDSDALEAAGSDSDVLQAGPGDLEALKARLRDSDVLQARLQDSDVLQARLREKVFSRIGGIGSGVASKLSKARLSDEVLHSASTRLDRHEMRQVASSVEAPIAGDPLHTYMRTANVARIDVENLRAIEKLETEIRPGEGDHVGWKVLLGENGVGKSTVLQAVALALMGKKHLDMLVAQGHLEPEMLLRRGAERGHIHVYLTTSNQPLRIELTPGGVEFEVAEAGLQTILLGFGSARWLPRKGSLPPDDGEYLRVRNLFNPFVPLGDALGWLHGRTPEELDRVESTLLRLLDLGRDVRLVKDGDRICVQRGDQPLEHAIPLGALSDGYQTVLALACEIMELMGRRWGGDMSSAEGVVLIDEIGAHLHPRWKLRVVKSLREAFPRIQFLVTTHEPLCLRGLYDGELMVMRRSEGRLMVLDDLASPDDLRVEQLLTSPLFGLQSTRSPELERQFEEYYNLLARKGSLAAEERQRLNVLRREVGDRGVLGDSPRDRMVYELVDEMLARSRGASKTEKKQLKASTRRRVNELWKRLDGPGAGDRE